MKEIGTAGIEKRVYIKIGLLTLVIMIFFVSIIMNIFFIKKTKNVVISMNTLINDQIEITEKNNELMDRIKEMTNIINNFYNHEQRIQDFILNEQDNPMIPNILPIEYSMSNHITSNFGLRLDPFKPNTGNINDIKNHSGADFSSFYQAPVRSTMDGVVIHHWPVGPGYKGHPIAGGYIVIRNSKGYETHYAHLSKTFIREGYEVKQGQIIGRIGNTGETTGPHLHYEIHYNGKLIDPIKFLNIKSQLDIKIPPNKRIEIIDVLKSQDTASY